MRIQSIRFKNLNSLVGEWEIDLTDSVFAAEGIFAITGPTGSGKTTILDAICLALYGRTPRLNRVNKNTNEIMSRQTGDCFAEICFEAQSDNKTKRYRCFWSQHRARKKPQGDLQSPKHEIANADTGEVLEEKLSLVAQKIIQITGMDFERFTRSMLLAQGGFAAFLEAAADERAPILEQITGTEIYSHISIKVHELKNLEQKKLDTLQAEMSGMELLTEEEESLLKQLNKEKDIEEKKYIEQYRQFNKAIQWRQLIERYTKEQVSLAEQQQQSQQRILNFQPQYEKLVQARKALELSADYATLVSLRKEQENDLTRLSEYQTLLPKQQLQREEQQQIQQFNNEHIEQKKIQQKDSLLIIRQVRDIDLKIQEKESPIKMAEEKRLEGEKLLQSYTKKIADNEQILQQNNKQLQSLSEIIKNTQQDEKLVGQLTGINTQFNGFRDLNRQQQNKQAELGEAEKNYSKDSIEYDALLLTLNEQKTGLSDLQNNVDEASRKLSLLQENKELSVWRSELSQYQQKQSLFEQAEKQYNGLTELQEDEKDLLQRSKVLTGKQRENVTKLDTLETQSIVINRELQLLEDKLALQNKIQAFEEQRKQLKNNEACPLCGSKDHPYVEVNIPHINKTQLEVDSVKARLLKHNSCLSQGQIEQAENSKELEQIDLQKNKLSDKIKQCQEALKQLIEKLDDSHSPASVKLLHQQQQDNSAHIESLSKKITDIEVSEKYVLSCRQTLEQSKEQISELKLKTQAAQHQCISAKKIIDRYIVEYQQQEDLITENLLKLQHKLRVYNIQNLSLSSLDTIEALLSRRRTQWLHNNENSTQLEQTIQQLNLQQDHQKDSKQKLMGDLAAQQQEIAILCEIKDALLAQRKDLFADKSCDQETERLSAELESAEQAGLNSGKKLTELQQSLLQLQTNIDAVNKEVSLRNTQLKNEESRFIISLQRLSLDNEAHFNKASLSEQQRNALSDQEKILDLEKTELNVKIHDNRQQLEQEQQKNLSDHNLSQLQEELWQIEKLLKDLQGELGAIKQKIKDNDALRKTQQARAELMIQQKKECARWQLLHDLIGSADGKKYRNFAQGLTFEMMVAHANQQLQKMTPRYLLMRDNKQPLELNVIDNFQAGEIRSTKNLSGGESFIVSLCLALGLSQMASKNVRVDSLFLDEGFGTLDEEALDMALETLSGLQQEGKLIGVISHVQALKDRISTQILVNPVRGGRSEIRGQGGDFISTPDKAIL